MDLSTQSRAAVPANVERRTVAVTGLRAEAGADGATYLVGYAAKYGVLSSDLGWFRERIMPGAFKRAVDEKQDVYHLINHDPSQILGRTTSGTTTLTEDATGLSFRTLINKDDHHAVNFAAQVARGDIDQCSFGFVCRGQQWVTDRDPDNPKVSCDVREVTDLDLWDISTVAYPAYPQTKTALAAIRSVGGPIPADILGRIMAGIKGTRDVGDDDPSLCACDCLACQDGECEDCYNEDCDDENCLRCGMRSAPAAPETREAKTKRVDGEDLTSECFIIVGEADDPSTWKLPWKFSTDEKTKAHLRNALARFNQMKSVSEEVKKAAWEKLVRLCKDHGIDVSDDENKSIRERGKLTDEQIASFSAPTEADLAARAAEAVRVEQEAAAARERYVRTLQIQSSL